MNIKESIDTYLGKNTRMSTKNNGDGTSEICDLDTGICYTYKEKDGLIERSNTKFLNKKVMVENNGKIKQLLND